MITIGGIIIGAALYSLCYHTYKEAKEYLRIRKFKRRK